MDHGPSYHYPRGYPSSTAGPPPVRSPPPTRHRGPVLYERDVVFVDPLDPAARYWWPAMIVPRDEIDSSMLFSSLGPDQCLVKYFEDCQTFAHRAGQDFFNDRGVDAALDYLETGRLQQKFVWKYWGRGRMPVPRIRHLQYPPAPSPGLMATGPVSTPMVTHPSLPAPSRPPVPAPASYYAPPPPPPLPTRPVAKPTPAPVPTPLPTPAPVPTVVVPPAAAVSPGPSSPAPDVAAAAAALLSQPKPVAPRPPGRSTPLLSFRNSPYLPRPVPPRSSIRGSLALIPETERSSAESSSPPVTSKAKAAAPSRRNATRKHSEEDALPLDTRTDTLDVAALLQDFDRKYLSVSKTTLPAGQCRVASPIASPASSSHTSTVGGSETTRLIIPADSELIDIEADLKRQQIHYARLKRVRRKLTRDIAKLSPSSVVAPPAPISSTTRAAKRRRRN
ncbi:hypothetical protein IWQ60_004237 [Tieghemiomyces parasiticus]|uniref:PWWP domain-containing protein n=1 Tax=Tieghemiomyces parasiticus TaxID=78921 RepID=A0A9W8A8M6_9FUNG|nr:hypothetical protein IWQ60_004237 [Tieghemiomyces parasiticus]